MSSNPVYGYVYSIQHYLIKFVSDLRQRVQKLHNIIETQDQWTCRRMLNIKKLWQILTWRPSFALEANERLGIISLAHALFLVTDFPVVNVPVDELSSARIWQHKLCATLFASVNINYRLPIKVYYRIGTLRHIRIEINHGSQNVIWVLTWVSGY